jgi:hypothetical protein
VLSSDKVDDEPGVDDEASSEDGDVECCGGPHAKGEPKEGTGGVGLAARSPGWLDDMLLKIMVCRVAISSYSR